MGMGIRLHFLAWQGPAFLSRLAVFLKVETAMRNKCWIS